MPVPNYSNDAVKHYDLVAWAENSKGTKYQRHSSEFDEDSNLVTTGFQVENKTLSFRLGWRSSSHIAISAYCRVIIHPSVDKNGLKIAERRIHRLMNKKIPVTQTCHTTSGTDSFTRRYHPIFRQAPGSDDALKLTSARLEVRFLRQDITEDGLRDMKVAIQAANDEGTDLDDELVDANCETESPSVVFQFDFYPVTRNLKSQPQPPQSRDHSEGPSESKKRQRTLESDSEDPTACDTSVIKDDSESIAEPAAQKLTNNVESAGVEDQIQTLQELMAEEKSLEDDLKKLIETKRRRIEVMRQAIGEFKKNSSTN